MLEVVSLPLVLLHKGLFTQCYRQPITLTPGAVKEKKKKLYFIGTDERTMGSKMLKDPKSPSAYWQLVLKGKALRSSTHDQLMGIS